MTSKRMKVSYKHTVVYTVLIGVIGALLLVMSHVVKNTDYSFCSEVLRDFGMVLLPIFVVGMVYELSLRKQFDHSLSTIITGIPTYSNFTQLVFQDQRIDKMTEIIESAREKLVIVGTSPLLEFCRSPEFLIKKFTALRSVTIAYLDPQSRYLEGRIIQAGNVGMHDEIALHQRLIDTLKGALKGSNVEFIAYDLPPAEFFYICDDRMLLFTWYPFGRPGEQSPCLFVDDLQKNQESRHLLHLFSSSLNFVKATCSPDRRAA